MRLLEKKCLVTADGFIFGLRYSGQGINITIKSFKVLSKELFESAFPKLHHFQEVKILPLMKTGVERRSLWLSALALADLPTGWY